MTQGWLKIKDASAYAGVSKRTFEEWLKNGLRYVKPGGNRLTKPGWIDSYLENFEVKPENVDNIVDDVMRGLNA